jgi:acyl carrier protein
MLPTSFNGERRRMQSELAKSVQEVVVGLFLDGDASVPIALDTNLIESGITDSMGLVQLAAALESRFATLRIQDQDITRETLGCIAAIVEFLERSGVA